MAKLDVLTLLDDLEAHGLREPLFREKLHHLGGTIKQFRSFVAGVGFFRKSGCNQLLHDRLEFIRTQCDRGALGHRTMEELVEEAKRTLPCKAYLTCKKHVSDPNCTKPG
jgi:hypothetical protein